MFEKIKQWWFRAEIREKQLSDRIDALASVMATAEAEKAKLEEQLQTAENTVKVFRDQQEADEAKRNGTDPWVEIRSADYSDVKGIQIELDWNEAFIQYLKDNGFKGKDEELVVQKWLGFLYQDLIERLEQQTIDNSDKPRDNEYL